MNDHFSLETESNGDLGILRLKNPPNMIFEPCLGCRQARGGASPGGGALDALQGLPADVLQSCLDAEC